MPHSAEFKEPKDSKDPKGHPVASKLIPEKCVMCHTKKNPNFCNECHHGTQVDFTYDPAKPWAQQHPKAVAKSGLKSCLDKCHAVKFCADCHTQNRVFPASHKQPYWTHSQAPTMTKYGSEPASATALHSVAANQSTEQCEVCHGTGGLNAPFCKACHKLEMPHSKEFKQFHSKTGRQNPQVCLNCHTWPQLCSNCHHVGSSTTVPWIKVHGASVSKNGAGGCIDKCHKQAACAACHTARKVVPASHKTKDFIKVPGAARRQPRSALQEGRHRVQLLPPRQPRGPAQLRVLQGLPQGRHAAPGRFRDEGSPGTAVKGECGLSRSGDHLGPGQSTDVSALSRACLLQRLPPPGLGPDPAVDAVPPVVVKKSGAEPCYTCHTEQQCSNCHVNLAKRGLLK